MNLQLEGKVVIVTGASEGLGKAVATEFAKEGAHVFISSRSEDKLKVAAEEIIKKTGNKEVNHIVCDMKNDDQIRSLVQRVVQAANTVDVLIHNAGGPPAGKFIDITDDQWFEAFEQNLLSVVRTTRAVIPYMKEQGEGRIVNITSSSIKESIDNLIVSNTLRPGVLGITKSLSQELAPDNILVNTVGPGRIATNRLRALNELSAKIAGKTLEEITNEQEASIPLGRYGQPEEFAKAVVFLASFANTYITGQALLVDGATTKAL